MNGHRPHEITDCRTADPLTRGIAFTLNYDSLPTRGDGVQIRAVVACFADMLHIAVAIGSEEGTDSEFEVASIH